MKRDPPAKQDREKTQNTSISNIDDGGQLVAAVRKYQALSKQGATINPSDFVANYPEIADELKDCLEGLEIVQEVSDTISQPAKLKTLGGFRIKERIGSGGMGTVYKAEEILSGHSVAVKVLHSESVFDDRRLRRFQLEAQTAALLDHPNIVPVISVGSENGTHYYAMRYIRGCNLAVAIECLRSESKYFDDCVSKDDSKNSIPDENLHEFAQETSISSEAQFDLIARLVVQAADALNYAHEQGVIHRDVKPSNLLIDAQGKLWVTDFGLARLPNEMSISRSSDVLGTLRYMSPQQLLGKRELVDRRTDVYSLGATLYEMLTLRPAIACDLPSLIHDSILNKQPTPIETFRPDIPIALVRIVSKAMARNLDDRYRSAGEFADDLRRFLRRESVLARPPGIVLRVKRHCEKHLVGVLAACAALFLLLTVAIVTAFLFSRESAAKSNALAAANSQRELAEHREKEVRIAERAAEHNLKQAVRAIDNYFSLITSDDTLQRRDLQELRMKLLSSALPFLQELKNREGGESVDIDETTAYARFRLGAILLEMRDYEGAVEELRLAGELFDKLRRNNPENHLHAVNQISAYNNAARVLDEMGSDRQAEQCYKVAWRFQEKYIEDFPAAAMVAGLLRGDLKYCLASLYYNRGDLEKAKQECRHAIELTEECAKRLPGYQQAFGDRRPFLGEYRALLGMILEKTGQHEEAVELLRLAIAEFGKTKTPRTELKLARIRINYAKILLSDDPQQSLALCDHAITLLEEILNRTDMNIGNPNHLVSAYGIASLASTALNRKTESSEFLDKADALLKQSNLSDNPNRCQAHANEILQRAREALLAESSTCDG